MSNKRRVEVFTAGCYVCNDVVNQIQSLSCENCEVVVYDLNQKCDTNECEDKAKQYGIQSVPAIAIDGAIVNCCTNTDVDLVALKQAGLGQ